MSKNIAKLAIKFNKLISLGEPTPEELDTITGKNVPQRVLVPWDLKNKLSQLIDNWRNRVEVIAIKKVWQELMANGVSSPDGIMIYGGGNLTPMLNALTALGTLAQDPKTGTPEVELGEIHDMYVAFSQLSAPKIPTPKAPVSNDNVIEPFNPKVKQVQEILNDLDYPHPLNPDGKLGPQTRLALKWFRTFRLGLKLLSDADTMNAVIQNHQLVELPAPTDKSSTWGDTKASKLANKSPVLTKLADRFLKVLASDMSSMFAVSITTVDPKRSRLAMLSFMHQLESSPYRAMIKYVQDHRNDGTLLIAFREPVSKDTVLEICNSLSLSFSHHDDDKFFAGGDDELIVTDIDVESYSVYPVKETLAFTIVAKSSDDALALADELKRFARIKDTQTQENVVQVTFKESSSVSELRAMCEKLSRLPGGFPSAPVLNQIDIDSLTISEQ